jgi:hypothetical protein
MTEYDIPPVMISVYKEGGQDRIRVTQNPVQVFAPAYLRFVVDSSDWEFPDPSEAPYTQPLVIHPNPNQIYPFGTVIRDSSGREVRVYDTLKGSIQSFRYSIYLRHRNGNHVVIHDPGINNEA